MRFLHIIKKALLIGITANLFCIPVLHAEGEATTSQEVECTMDNDTKRLLAIKARQNLWNMKKAYDRYKKDLDDNFKNGGPCNYQYSYWKGTLTSELNWGDYDAQGVEIGQNALKPTDSPLTDAFNSVKGKLADTDYDLTEYQKTNSKNLARINAILSLWGANEGATATNTYTGVTYTKTNGVIKGGEVIAINDRKKEELLKDQRTYTQCHDAFAKLITSRNAMQRHRIEAHNYLTSLAKSDKAKCICTLTKTQDATVRTVSKCEVEDDSFVEDDVDTPLCKQLNEYQSDLSVCVLCELFEKILLADASLAKGAFDALKGGLLKLLAIAFGIYLGYESLLLVGSPATQTPGKYLTTVITQGFKVAIATLLLINSTEIYQLIITPLVDGGLDFGLNLIPGSSKQVINQHASSFTHFDRQNEYMPAPFLQKVMGAVKGFNDQAAKIPAIGRSLMCNAWVDPIWGVLPHTGVLVEGAIVYIFGLIIMLAVGFYLLDCVIELGLCCCLVPFFVACWPFKMTARYTKTGWGMLMNVFFNFVMMGVVIGTALSLITQALAAGVSPEELELWLNDNNILALQVAMNIGGLQMLMLVVCCVMALKMIKEVGNLANKFDSGAGVSLGADLGGVAASTAMAVAKGAGAAAGGVAMKAGGAIAEASGAKGAGAALKNKAGGAIKSIAGKAGIGGKAVSSGGRKDSGNGDKGGDKGGNSGGDKQ